MTALQQLKSILPHEYESENGDIFKIELLEGMSNGELSAFKQQLPGGVLPPEVEELLRFARGFEFGGLDEIRFDAFGVFGFDAVFPNSMQLAGDGFGNFWVLDIDSRGNWNSVYYVCHDPRSYCKTFRRFEPVYCAY